jgi:hypothetical protein
MTSQDQPPNQNLEKSKFGGGHDDLNNLSSFSSSSSSRQLITPYQAPTRFRKETGLENQAEFFCPATAKEKD